MEITTVNQIIAAGAGLTGALVGASISGFVNYRLEHSKRNYESKALLAGFVGEVTALRDIIIFRGYYTTLSDMLNWEVINKGGSAPFRVNLPKNYARFFDANLGKIGMLPHDKLKKLMQFHQIIFAIAQDFNTDSELYQLGFHKEAIEQTVSGLGAALQLADEIAKWEVK